MTAARIPADLVGNLVVNVAILRHAELGDLWPVSAVRDIGSLVGIYGRMGVGVRA
jgi:hypothetical protein